MREFFNAHFGSTGTGARLLPMEGLRGVAALLVFFVHFDCLFRPYLREGSLVGTLADVAGNFGHTGVDLFFVLSGFLIYGILIKKHVDYGDFLWRRVKRLYPVFLVVLGLYLVLSVLYPSYSKLPHSWPHALMLVGANLLMLPGVTNIPAIITVSWSLSYEWLFYLTVPLLIVVLGLRRWNPRHRVMFFRLLIIGKYALWSFGLSEHIRRFCSVLELSCGNSCTREFRVSCPPGQNI